MSMNSDDEIRALCDAATPGPWRREGDWIDAGEYDQVIAPDRVECMSHCYGGSSRIDVEAADLEFIAAARSLVPELLDRAVRAEAERDAALAKVAAVRDELRAEGEAHAVQYGAADQRFRDGLSHAWAKLLPLRGALADAPSEGDVQ